MPDVVAAVLTQASKFCAISGLDCLGCLASGCVLLTFCMQSMVRLRVIALLSNVAFIAYGWAGRLVPILVLHCMLLLINSAALMRIIGGRVGARNERSRLLEHGNLEEPLAT